MDTMKCASGNVRMEEWSPCPSLQHCADHRRLRSSTPSRTPHGRALRTAISQSLREAASSTTGQHQRRSFPSHSSSSVCICRRRTSPRMARLVCTTLKVCSSGATPFAIMRSTKLSAISRSFAFAQTSKIVLKTPA